MEVDVLLGFLPAYPHVRLDRVHDDISETVNEIGFIRRMPKWRANHTAEGCCNLCRIRNLVKPFSSRLVARRIRHCQRRPVLGRSPLAHSGASPGICFAQ